MQSLERLELPLLGTCEHKCVLYVPGRETQMFGAQEGGLWLTVWLFSEPVPCFPGHTATLVSQHVLP